MFSLVHKYGVLLGLSFCLFACNNEEKNINGDKGIDATSAYELEDFVGKWKFGIKELELKADKTFAAYLDPDRLSIKEVKVKNWGFWKLSNDTLSFSDEQGGNVNRFIVHSMDSLQFENPRKSSNTPLFMLRTKK
ncbi:MAG: hypothetical protein MK212_04210 [Saprospiraceae bacterium]|nr:hypothetical protein [Saprospiraceae bacterium]